MKRYFKGKHLSGICNSINCWTDDPTVKVGDIALIMACTEPNANPMTTHYVVEITEIGTSSTLSAYAMVAKLNDIDKYKNWKATVRLREIAKALEVEAKKANSIEQYRYLENISPEARALLQEYDKLNQSY